MARDGFHDLFRSVLEHDGWIVTDDPLTFKIGKVHVQIDLGAERLIAAQKGQERIAVEIKTFVNASFITALYEAIGKYVVYKNVLKLTDPNRTLYLAVPKSIYDRFFEEPVLKKVIAEERVNLVIYNEKLQRIDLWVK